MNYKRGDIVLVLFPDSSLRTAKRRPVLVIQADSLKTGLNQTIVAMITSNLARANYPSRVAIGLQTLAGQQSGLLTDSVIMTDNLATIRNTEIDRVLGRWSNMADVEAALRHTLDIA
jgi:mRNA interferase MazF